MTKIRERAAMPPGGLSNRAQELWRSLVPRRARSPERQALLEAALRALDRAAEAAEVVAREGMSFTTKKTGAVHMHPMLRVERENKGFFLSVWSALGLTWSQQDAR